MTYPIRIKNITSDWLHDVMMCVIEFRLYSHKNGRREYENKNYSQLIFAI